MLDDKEKNEKPEEKKPKTKAKSKKAKSTQSKPKAKKEAPPPESELRGFTSHIKAAGVASIKQWRSLLPDKFWMYGKEAGYQTLLAVRSLIEDAAEKIDVDGENTSDSPPPKRKTKKKVEVE